MERREGVVYLAVNTEHPERVKVGRGAEAELAQAGRGPWRIAYARRVRHPQTVERIIRDHLARVGGRRLGEAEYETSYSHATMVLDTLAREFEA